MPRMWRRFLIGLVVLVILAGNGLILFCWRHNVWSRDEWMIYKELDRGSDPSWREYHFARIRAGDPVDEVLARTEPVTVVQQGRWTFLKYKKIGAAAYDGRMVYAGAMSCCWERIFFDELTDAQCREFFGRSRAQVDQETDELRRRGTIIVK